jgi:hypothetical protein
MFSELARDLGWEVGIAKTVFTYNLELTAENGGYTREESAGDPRRAGYGPAASRYEPLSWETLEPPAELLAWTR